MAKAKRKMVSLGRFREDPDNVSEATEEEIRRLAGKLKRVPQRSGCPFDGQSKYAGLQQHKWCSPKQPMNTNRRKTKWEATRSITSSA